MVRNQPIQSHNTWNKVGAVFARCLHLLEAKIASMDFGSRFRGGRGVQRFLDVSRFLSPGGWQVRLKPVGLVESPTKRTGILRETTLGMAQAVFDDSSLLTANMI